MNIYDEVKGAVTIGISGHIRPDGDCIGAAVGLYLYLKKACPSADVQVMLEKPADVFSCIKGGDNKGNLKQLDNITEESKNLIKKIMNKFSSGKTDVIRKESSQERMKKKIDIELPIL